MVILFSYNFFSFFVQIIIQRCSISCNWWLSLVFNNLHVPQNIWFLFIVSYLLVKIVCSIDFSLQYVLLFAFLWCHLTCSSVACVSHKLTGKPRAVWSKVIALSYIWLLRFKLRQKEKDKYHAMSLICEVQNMTQINLFTQQRQTHRHGNKFMVTKGEGKG